MYLPALNYIHILQNCCSDTRQMNHQASDANGAAADASPPPTPAKTRLRKLHSAPIKDFLSTGTDMDSLRPVYILYPLCVLGWVCPCYMLSV